MEDAKRSAPATDDAGCIQVEVIYALPDQQRLLNVRLPADATVADAVERSGVLQQYPELLHAELPWSKRVGIFGQQCASNRKLQDGDRVEIYRPLRIDPKQARRQRAELQSEN
jgi:uncharacterized protein